MEVLVLDGKSYVKASKAARDLGYATDYVGQLCRTGQVSAHLIGRTWYVNKEELSTHKVEKKRMSRVKAREQAHALIASNRLKITKIAEGEKVRNISKNIAISYEPDKAPLIPETRKLRISSEYHAPAVVEDEQRENVIQNKGEKILMSGDLEVFDVTDDVGVETTVFRPKILKSDAPTHKERVPEHAVSVQAMEEESPEAEEVSHTDFEDETTSVAFVPVKDANVNESERVAVPSLKNAEGGSKLSFFMHTLLILIVFSVVLASLPVYTKMTYDINRSVPFESHLGFDYQYTKTKLITYLKNYIAEWR